MLCMEGWVSGRGRGWLLCPHVHACQPVTVREGQAFGQLLSSRVGSGLPQRGPEGWCDSAASTWWTRVSPGLVPSLGFLPLLRGGSAEAPSSAEPAGPELGFPASKTHCNKLVAVSRCFATAAQVA